VAFLSLLVLIMGARLLFLTKGRQGRALNPSLGAKGITLLVDGKRVVIRSGYTIGRQGADVEFRDAKMSAVHARVLKSSNGWIIEDLQSSNGTYVNGQKIQTSKLAPGDVVRMGAHNWHVSSAD